MPNPSCSIIRCQHHQHHGQNGEDRPEGERATAPSRQQSGRRGRGRRSELVLRSCIRSSPYSYPHFAPPFRAGTAAVGWPYPYLSTVGAVSRVGDIGAVPVLKLDTADAGW